MPEISVILPTYGEPDRLVTTINSVINQSFSDIELIVVDDNNPTSEYRNKTSDIVKVFASQDKRVRYICHDHNKNGSAARNTGIRESKGKYLSFLDSDDEYATDRLLKCYNILKERRDKEFQGVYTGCEFRRNGKPYHIETSMADGNYLVQCLASTFNICSGSNIFITKEAALEINGFDESFIRQQDIEFLVRFFQHFSILGIKEVLLVKNQDGKNRPSPEKLEKIKAQFLKTFESCIKIQQKKDQDYIYSHHYQQIAEQYLAVGNRIKALEYYNAVKSLNGYSFKCIIRKYCYLLKLLR